MRSLSKPTRFLVTGGAGFIGSAFLRYGLTHLSWCEKIVNLDLLTYSANLDNLSSIATDPRYLFVQGDIRDQKQVTQLLEEHALDAIVHFAAESHVDRSIASPHTFYATNVEGTLALLEVVRRYPSVHFHQISTDEVFGSLSSLGKFSETSPYQPNSPYAASKAAADHCVRAYAHTYGLSISISYCTNNYGPGQHVEKFIPRMISGCFHKTPLPLYGTGENVRDWIFVDDHVEAVWEILAHKKSGQVYGIGGECEMKNNALLQELIAAFAKLRSEDPLCYHSLITPVPDRPGHDLRYAIDCTKIRQELGWSPRHDIVSGLQKTLTWYLKHPERLGVS